MIVLAILVGLLVIGVLFLVGSLVMMRRENRQLREDLSQTAPGRDSQFATPYIPPQQPHRPWSDVKDGRDTPPWQPGDGDLDDPNARSTPPHDPAS